MAEVSKGVCSRDGVISPVQIVPPLMQMYPDIDIEFADDVGASLHEGCGTKNRYTWLFAGRTVYLFSPPSSSSSMGEPRVLYSEDNSISSLLQVYLAEISCV